MPDTRTYYVICGDNCKFESMTKEQIIAAIAEATSATPTHIDDAFITKIKESNANVALTFWKGTQAEFNALSVTAPAYKIGIDSNSKIYLTPVTYPTPAAAGNFAALDASGNIIDSQKKASDFYKRATFVSRSMLAANWSNGQYSFESDFPSASYDVAIEVSETASTVQYQEFSAAMIVGSTSNNIVKSLGTVPTIDIPILIKVVEK